jgi:hypothetical protein
LGGIVAIESTTQKIGQAMSIPSDTDLLIESCKKASIFPKNIVHQFTPLHHLEGYFNRLDEQAPRLFCEDGQAALDIWEYDDNVKGATRQTVSIVDTQLVNL